MELCKAILLSATAVLSIGISSSAWAVHPAGTAARITLQSIDAEQARLRSIDFEMAPIKSQADLAAYLRSAGRNSPLMALSPGARDRFIASLAFNENGLVGYNHEELGRELTASQAYRLLALFGAQRTTHLVGARIESDADRVVAAKPIVPQLMSDHDGFRCLGAHNCFETPLFICMTGC